MITPYLHERRIYLNRVKLNTQYFYTAVQTFKDQEDLYVESLKQNRKSENMKKEQSVEMVSMMELLLRKKDGKDGQ
jgi:hypothetical protein